MVLAEDSFLDNKLCAPRISRDGKRGLFDCFCCMSIFPPSMPSMPKTLGGMMVLRLEGLDVVRNDMQMLLLHVSSCAQYAQETQRNHDIKT